jgi:MinD-like ATPase involved in chromosome partitioning or flagellar assembly
LDLPTYTNIWRIEKRLYKLYDFRLPMPIPVGQIAVFAAIAVPYVLILKVAGLPFSHTLLWLYILPPGALAWLVTRPVLEGKRLPELVVSQLRYLNEPRTWCRMAPLAERDETAVVVRVWRRAASERPAARQPAVAAGMEVAPVLPPAAEAVEPAAAAGIDAASVLAPAAETVVPPPAAAAVAERPALERHLPTGPVPAWPEAAPAAGPVGRPAPESPAQPRRPAPVPPSAAIPGVPPSAAIPGQAASAAIPGQAASAAIPGQAAARAVPAAAAPPPAQPSPSPPRPVVTVTGDAPGERPTRMVERALGNPSQRRAAGWHDRVVVVPGGHRPGRPDQLQRDRARARLPIAGGHRVVVLGCTVGAGQTVAALMTGELLASLRDEQVAVLDLNPGDGSLAQRARAVPSLTGSGHPAPSRLEIVTREAGAAGAADADDVTRIFELLAARYPLTLADPGAAAVPRVLAAASQLILVAPASQDAAAALAATREWLEAHGHAGLADGAITVLNGVSRHTMPHVEQAEALARGRCRAIVRVPWDDGLRNTRPERVASPRQDVPAAPGAGAGTLSLAALQAYTALAGVLVTALASSTPEQLRVDR